MTRQHRNETGRSTPAHRMKFFTLAAVALIVFILSPVENADSSAAPTSEIITESIKPAVSLSPASDSQRYRVNLDFSDTSERSPTLSFVEPQQTKSHRYIVKHGDTFSAVMEKHGFSPQETIRLASLKDQQRLFSQLKPDQVLEFEWSNNNDLAQLTYHRNQLELVHITQTDGGHYTIGDVSRPVETRIEVAAGQIDNSLFLSGVDAGLSDNVIMKLADVFTWDIDFTHDLRPGDQFSVVYESHYVDGQKIKDGKILAAEFVTRGKIRRALAFQEGENKPVNYFTPDGRSLKKSFVRNPVSISRISSGFNLKRKHPVLNTIRAHRGVDYAAPTGTPIYATGDGRVTFVGRKGGYGKTIVLSHAGKYSTLYAHLNSYAKSTKRGKTVRQGQIIGYVGSSGLATGPHLHYEFRVNGTHQNPLTVKFPRSAPLAENKRGEFRQQTEELVAQLDTLARTNIATAVVLD